MPCTNASVPSSTLYNPPPFSYNQVGSYNIQLIVNEGDPTQAGLCKSVIVMPQQLINLGSDREICPGTTTTLDAGAGFLSYLWSTGATTRMITVSDSGIYWAKGTRYGCEAFDTINVSLFPVTQVYLGRDTTICVGQTVTFDAGSCSGCSYLWSNLTTGQTNIGTGQTYTTGITGEYSVIVTGTNGCPTRDSVQLFTASALIQGYADTTLCYGTPFYTGGALQTHPGIYFDTIPVTGKCDSIIQTTLRYKPEIPVSLGNDTIVCAGSPIKLRTGVPSAEYQWQDGSTDSTFTVFVPGSYWVMVTKEGCNAADSIMVGECISPLWFPNAFTPNGDGVNDTFYPPGWGVIYYEILIFDRWGRKVFESNKIEPGWDGSINGNLCSDGVYVFIATYSMADSSGETYHAKGSITLLR
jgi:gliding motility-associated-like protein